MEVQDFIDFLDKHDISYNRAGQSIVLKHCPACGRDDYKVYLRAIIEDDVLLGRCYAGNCQENYSSFKYLKMIGIDEQAVRALHVCDAQENLNKILQITSHDQQLKMPNSIEQLGTQGMDYVDLSEFKYFLECESHPVVKYAYSRGVTPAHFNKIMVCPKSNAVVFVVFKGMIPVGWQKRYLNPIENRKTKTSPGFKRGLALLDFPNTGPIAICEGPFTALSAWHFGYHGVCTFGSAVTDDQVVLLKTLIQQTDKEVVIAFDLDDAGKKGAQLIRRGLNNLIINDLVPETGNDLNESWMNKTGAIIVPYINNPLPKLEFENEG